MCEKIQMWLADIVSTGKYDIITLDYCGGCFGNYCVVIQSNKSKIGMQIQIIKDRDILYCSVRNKFGSWIPIEKVFEYFRIEPLVFPVLDEEYFKYICEIILRYENILDNMVKKYKKAHRGQWCVLS